MGNLQSQLKNNTATVAITTSFILIGGLYYYARSYQTYKKQSSTKIQYADDLGCMLIPAESKHRQSGHEQMQHRKKGYDARHKVIKNSKLGRSTIMKCIGRIVSSDKEKHNLTPQDCAYFSTATVFTAKDGYFLVITCAHSFLYSDTSDTDNKTYPIKKRKYIYFQRIETFRDEKAQVVETYRLKDLKPNDLQFTALRNGDKYKYITADKDENDLAVLAFEDPCGYYKKMFDEKSDEIIHLQAVGKIPKNVTLTYNVYGYPCGNDKIAQGKGVKMGELWGMRSQSFSVVETENKYVIRKEKYFYYNAIDTEEGQSGSAIYLCKSNGTYAIVGVHTYGTYDENVGVALTEDKIRELCDAWNI
eukprot:144260_1